MSAEPSSATTFENPVEDSGQDVDLNRTVTIFASGTVTVDDALTPGKIVLKQEDIRAAIGVGSDQYIPPLSGAKISHYFNPTSQRLGLRVHGGTDDKPKALVQNSAHARNPFAEKMEGFTAVIPSNTQGNLNQQLDPLTSAKGMSPEQAEMMRKWRGLKTGDLTDGILETRAPDGEGGTRTVKYDVPLVKSDGKPQPVAYMLEKNRDQFPGFSGDDIGDKIHEYDGQQYYSVPPKYVHFLIGSMQENLIEKSGLALDGDITIDVIPLSPIMNAGMRNAPSAAKKENMERMVALELTFESLDLSGDGDEE